MNIFVTDICPIKSATYLDSKRVIKMILESAQLLSTAINENGGVAPYKTTHLNHPCSKWVRETRSNYEWLYKHFKALCNEYTYRYSKAHKCVQYAQILSQGAQLISTGPLTDFVNCTTYKDESNVFVAYKKYLNDKWKNDKRKPTW